MLSWQREIVTRAGAFPNKEKGLQGTKCGLLNYCYKVHPSLVVWTCPSTIGNHAVGMTRDVNVQPKSQSRQFRYF
jgi:hypothetical protein